MTTSDIDNLISFILSYLLIVMFLGILNCSTNKDSEESQEFDSQRRFRKIGCTCPKRCSAPSCNGEWCCFDMTCCLHGLRNYRSSAVIIADKIADTNYP